VRITGQGENKESPSPGWVDREIPRPLAGLVIVCFIAAALIFGLAGWIGDEARTAMTFPIVVATLLLAVWELRKKVVKWEAVANSLLALAASILIGYQVVANAKANALFAGVIYSMSVIVLALLFVVFMPSLNGRSK
jgi:hypothetical protein